MTYTQFKKLFEQNAMNNFWFFSTGYQLLELYPKFADRMFVEELKHKEAAE
ncbi:hypothetical protein UFOVP758_9 [uncultured Caudovirales phage]|uniref:Uncharacterized protein n=1 Tax=uncultured Caudovirales phage TaxID=2100421 RepID=A0A6J7X9V7_9CAUD|nr:hypothetical protein UFOVP758_9 [uncultured Caudovirales phage]